MRAVIFAYHDIGCEAIKTLKKMGVEICAVFTHKDSPGENVWFKSVKECSKKLDIPVYTTENPNSAEWVLKIRKMKPGIIFSFYYRRLISDDILSIPPKGSLNLHGSILPKYRGRAPVNWMILNGEKEAGLTLHYMTRKPDAGDIVAQRKVKISHSDSALTLYRKLLPLVGKILIETVPLLEKGTAPRIPQDQSAATYFGGRRPEDGKIDWTKSSVEVYNLVRAITHPYPGAFTFLNRRKVFVWRAGIMKKNISKPAEPGRIVSLKPLVISCGKDCVRILTIQTEGKKELRSAGWIKENPVQAGTLFRGGL